MSAAEIDANNRAFESAIATGNVDAIAVLLAPDVIALPPNAPAVAGRDAVKQFWASTIQEHGVTSCQFITDHLDSVGDFASEVGHATMTMAPPNGKSETVTIKYVVVWKRVDGTWLLHRDIWNAID
jgi:uncharacterized protein (TIGR02246 family)